MNRMEHLLSIVAEEAVEVAQRATKALRFGVHEAQPGQELSNLQRMRGELCDLLAAFEMVYDEAGHQFGQLGHHARELVDLDAIAAKKAKVEKFLAYSRELGTLTDGVEASRKPQEWTDPEKEPRFQPGEET
jgi:NTP pyrophosphatase (non-canonical NTP hydrolase)